MAIINRMAQAGIRALSSFVEDNEQPPQAKPKPGRFYSGWRDDYSRDSTLQTLTPAKLATAMQNAESGNTAAQYELFEIVEQDPSVTAVWNKRRRAITSKTLQITAADETDGRAVQAADLCSELILGKYGAGGIDNWHDALRDMTDAVGKGFSLQQIEWELDASRWRPKMLIYWPQRECQLGSPMKQFQQDEDTIRIITDASKIEGELLEPNQWVTHIHKTWSTNLARAGLFRAVTWFYLFKRFSWRDWMIFTERYGMPLRVGRYHDGADDAERAAIWAAVKDLGKDSACILPMESTIEFIEAKGSSGSVTLPYPDLIKHCNSEIAKCVLGNPMTTDPGEKGARSLGEVYERAETEMTEDDCIRLASTIRNQLCKPIVGFNLGWDVPLPIIKFAFEEDKDLNAQAKRDIEIVTKTKLPVAKSYFYTEYSIPEPEEGEELIELPKPPPSPFSSSQNPEDEGDEDGNDGDDMNANISAAAEILTLAQQKKKSVDWVISKMLSAEEQRKQ